jgi:copper transport protein
MTRSARPAARALVVALLAALCSLVGLVAAAGPAAAHASLEGGSVEDGQVLEVAPEEVVLDFNQHVTATRSGLRVFDAAGERVDEGGTATVGGARDRVQVELADDLPDGAYVLTYRVTSADGHPIAGALVFSVGEEVAASDELVAQVFSGGADRPWSAAAAVARWVGYGGALLAAGAVLALRWLRGDVEAGERRGAARWVRRGALATLVAAVLGVLLQVVLVTGDGAASLADAGAVAEVAGSFVGLSALVRVVGAALVLVALRRDGDPAGVLGLAGATALLGSFLLEGHTLTTGPAPVVWAGAAVHLVAGALWLGGLVVLALVLRARRRADDPVGAGRVVARASALLTAAVVGVLVAGTALSWAEVRAARALLDTSYGLVLLGKLAAVLPLVALGLWNNRRLVPLLTARRRRRAPAGQPVVAGGSDEVADRSRQRDAAWSALRRTVGLEVGAIAVVLALTGVLVSLQPAAEAAGITGAYSETVPFEGIGQMTFTVDPNRAGTNEIHLYLLGDTGRPVDVAESVTMRLVQPDLDIGPIEREPLISGPGHYVLTGPELSVPGRWEITTDVALSRFDVVSTTVEVVVNP